VADAFQKAGFPMEKILEDHGEITSESQNSMSGGLHLDLWLTNRLLLEEAGVCKENIHVAGICTYLNNDRFFSARREGVKCGRTINVIKMV
jgi:copper oxidase (laccase) domain-containing protein